jgi:hypothetical protein
VEKSSKKGDYALNKPCLGFIRNPQMPEIPQIKKWKIRVQLGHLSTYRHRFVVTMRSLIGFRDVCNG